MSKFFFVFVIFSVVFIQCCVGPNSNRRKKNIPTCSFPYPNKDEVRKEENVEEYEQPSSNISRQRMGRNPQLEDNITGEEITEHGQHSERRSTRRTNKKSFEEYSLDYDIEEENEGEEYEQSSSDNRSRRIRGRNTKRGDKDNRGKNKVSEHGQSSNNNGNKYLFLTGNPLPTVDVITNRRGGSKKMSLRFTDEYDNTYVLEKFKDNDYSKIPCHCDNYYKAKCIARIYISNEVKPFVIKYNGKHSMECNILRKNNHIKGLWQPNEIYKPKQEENEEKDEKHKNSDSEYNEDD